MRFASVFLTFLLVTGCAGRGTVSENQCAVGDWQSLGYRDGINGYRSTRLLEHGDACMKHDIVPDRSAYMLGWEEGIRSYCEPNNGFSVGERGWQHNNVCPADLRADFLMAYKEGRRLYMARVEVANLEREIEHKTNRLDAVNAQIVSDAAAQLNPDLTPAERIELGARVPRLYEEKRRLLDELPDLEAELEISRRELEHLNQTLASATF